MSRYFYKHFQVYFACAVALACLYAPASFASTPSSQVQPTFNQKTFSGVSTAVHADLNNDGIEDFISPSGAGFAVQLSTGVGTYTAPILYSLPSPNTVESVNVADVNSDGNADLLVFGCSCGLPGTPATVTLYLYINNGSGTFTPTASFPLSTNPNAGPALVGDFNHDGIMDFAFLDGSNLKTWFGDGKSGFSPGPTTPLSITPSAAQLMLGDFDGDGYADIAIIDPSSVNNVTVLYGDGTGYFPNSSSIQVPGTSVISVTDVNSDGKMDVVASNGAPYLYVYYGDADRNWDENTIIPVSHCASGAATAADMNGDGINDLVIPEEDCSNPGPTIYVGVLTRNPDSSYNPDQIILTSPNPWIDILSANVVRATPAGSQPDLAITQCAPSARNTCFTYTNYVLLNTTSGTFHSCDAPTTFEGIQVCMPAPGSAPSSPVSFHIGAAGQVPMRKVEVWVDGVKMGEDLNGYSHYSFLDSTFTLMSGTRQVDVYAAGWDNSLIEKSFTIYVQ